VIADDLFAGAGGWDLAAAQLGIHARGVENMKEARATREAAGLTTIHDDVWTFQPDGQASGLIASPPCQTYSSAGSGAGRQALNDVLAEIESGAYLHLEWLRSLGTEYGDERTALVLAPLHFAIAGGYEWLAWEQVATVLPVWQACAKVLRSHGWKVSVGVLDAADYGVPQNRKRAVLLGGRSRWPALPNPTHKRPVSLADALEWAPGTVVHHIRGAGMTERHGARPGRNYDQPCFTVTGKARSWMVDLPGGDRRPFELEEAAVVQTFPRDYPWQGSRSKQFLLVGNAVPPVLAAHVLATAAGSGMSEAAA
jgi:DNA (cytosine-5)-methyltransferase 1